jgi:hypothetical protein
MHSKLIFIILFLFSFQAMALEIDEKLTVRVLKTSESRKTILINRGTEDGLTEGEHAKFYVTAGVVARAACVRISPTRSVWAVYRLVNADLIVNDAVMTLRTTPAVKVTMDESKTLVKEDQPSNIGMGDPAALGIPLADGANDLNPEGSASGSESAELKAMLEAAGPTSIAERNKEVFLALMVSSLSSKTETDTGTNTFTGSQAFYNIMAGFEYYSQREKEWYSKFSLVGSASLIKESSSSFQGSQSENNITELSAGVNWHPGNLPSMTNSWIPYINLSANFSMISSSYTPGLENPTGDQITANGNGQGFAVGGGFKYYLSGGFGARVWADYYIRNEIYKESDSTPAFNKSVSGPRIFLSLAYRF